MTTLGPELRRDFPVLSRTVDGHAITYLDSAATSLKPRSVIDACSRYYTDVGANIHRGEHYLSDEASEHYEDARKRIAELLGCRADQIVLVKNTTEALNVVALGLSLSKDDTVLVSYDSHHSALLPFMHAAKVQAIRIDASGNIDLDHYAELLARHPKLVVINHCSNVTGIYAPVDKLVPMAKDAGALVVLDAAQSAPHRRLRTADLGVDFLAFSGHKMLGPTGIGVLYGRDLDLLDPVLLGGGTVDWVELSRYDLRKAPHRFEAGTPHIAGAYGMHAALDYLDGIGFEALQAHDRELSQLMYERAAEYDFLKVLAPGTTHDRSAIISMSIPGVHKLKQLARSLSDSFGIMCRTGHLCAQPLVDHFTDGEVLRMSAYVYNTRTEIEACFASMAKLARSIGA